VNVKIAPPPGYVVRPATWDDLPGVVELFRLADLEDLGEPDMNETAMRQEWEDPALDLAGDTWLLFEAPEAHREVIPVAYATLLGRDMHRQLQTWGVVRPDHRDRGLGSCLLDLVEARAGEHVPLAPDDDGVVLRSDVVGPDQPAHRLLEARGFRLVRHFWRMDVKLSDDIPGPTEIPGVRFRTFVQGRDERAIHAAHQEAFAENWGFVVLRFEEWSQERLGASAFNPDLWFVAEDGDEVAGFLMAVDEEGKIWIATLGVRAKWRRRGIGEALIRHAFREFSRRGYADVGLGVDSANETGATHLYERVGMHVTRQYDAYEKWLRGGARGGTR
jgi:mycothiol synthase